MSKFVVLLNSEITITDRLKSQISDARVVAVDGGMRHARALNVDPECWIGDFDSSTAELQNEWPDVQRMKHPVEKDNTDGELALDYVLAAGASEIVLVGGLGGQMDHSLGHLMQLIVLFKKTERCFATSGTEEAWPFIAGSFEWDFPVGTTVSLVGMTNLQELTISGVKWPLSDKNVEFGSTLTLSNEVTGQVCGRLTSGFGIALVKDII